MLFYDITFNCSVTFESTEEENKQDVFNPDDLPQINEDIEMISIFEGYNAVAYNAKDTKLSVCICSKPDKIGIEEAVDQITGRLEQKWNIRVFSSEHLSEITSRQASEYIGEAYEHCTNRSSRRRYLRDMGLDYYSNRTFSLSEEIVTNDDYEPEAGLEYYLDEAGRMLADESLIAEIERIFDERNSEKFYGYPVHYHISSGDSSSSDAIVKLLVRALYRKNRVPGARICKLFDISDGCYSESDFENVIKHAQGSSVVIELCGTECSDGDQANSYEAVIRFISEQITKYHDNTLFFLVENTQIRGFSKELINRATETIDLLEIREGRGDRESGERYFEALATGSRYADLYDTGALRYLDSKNCYRMSDVHGAFEKWSRDCLKTRAYSAYSDYKRKPAQKKKKPAQKRLDDMVGLDDAKRIINQIISTFELQDARMSHGLTKNTMSKHMIFTGNPGSAKTTVARLMTEILNEEGLLKTGAFVECGRNDLVGRYVGWTAKAVARKFRDASGGVLFIDEAYSLIDDRHSFGEEAINTIVREMENRRDDVIVIFAGYPDRMEEFINSNEGLRSRISFHVDFPDYSPSELDEILELMCRDTGYKLDKSAVRICHDMFERVYNISQYGNGRFVRNLLEQAQMRQAARLRQKGNVRDMSKRQLQTLRGEDFDISIENLCGSNERTAIGF